MRNIRGLAAGTVRQVIPFFAVLLGGFAGAQEISLPPREKFHLFLLVGQSNMAGRGDVEEQDRKPHPRVLMLSKEGKWRAAVDPMHFDKPEAAVGPGKTFGQWIAEANPGVTIGLISCAVGGSAIDTWKPGVLRPLYHDDYPDTKSYPWDDMAKRVALALPAGTLKGILWHQGESDAKLELAQAYEARLHDLIARLRALVNAPEVPFIAGQLGKFADSSWTPEQIIVNQAHQSLPTKVPHTAFVSAEGLNHKGDKVHFDAASARELGRRFAAAYLKLHPARAAETGQGSPNARMKRVSAHPQIASSEQRNSQPTE